MECIQVCGAKYEYHKVASLFLTCLANSCRSIKDEIKLKTFGINENIMHKYRLTEFLLELFRHCSSYRYTLKNSRPINYHIILFY